MGTLSDLCSHPAMLRAALVFALCSLIALAAAASVTVPNPPDDRLTVEFDVPTIKFYRWINATDENKKQDWALTFYSITEVQNDKDNTPAGRNLSLASIPASSWAISAVSKPVHFGKKNKFLMETFNFSINTPVTGAPNRAKAVFEIYTTYSYNKTKIITGTGASRVVPESSLTFTMTIKQWPWANTDNLLRVMMQVDNNQDKPKLALKGGNVVMTGKQEAATLILGTQALIDDTEGSSKLNQTKVSVKPSLVTISTEGSSSPSRYLVLDFPSFLDYVNYDPTFQLGTLSSGSKGISSAAIVAIVIVLLCGCLVLIGTAIAGWMWFKRGDGTYQSL